VLKGTTLYYFKTNKDSNFTGIIDISRDAFVKRDTTTKKKGCFCVGSSTGRVFLMYPDAEKQQETDAWINILNAVIMKKTTTPEPRVTITQPVTVKEPPKAQVVPKQTDVRAALATAKDYIPFLAPAKPGQEESKVAEFWTIWSESIPTRQELTDGSITFELVTSCTMDKLSWRCSGPQNLFIQKMVDFFWNVGAPESEIDRLNDVGAIVNPPAIGSWIDMSAPGGMDGGWFFPVEHGIKQALEAADEAPCVAQVLEWCNENGVSSCYSIGRDMGAAPPRQTEVKFLIGKGSIKEQLARARSAFDCFEFPFPPEEAVQILMGCTGGLALSVVTSSEGFVRIGLLFPKPPEQAIASLCSMSNASIPNHQQLQQALNVDAPEWIELQYLNTGYGYGVYVEGFEVAFHYVAGIETPIGKRL